MNVDIALLTGEFVIYQGMKYRVVSYWKEYELYGVEDTGQEKSLGRIRKDEVSDAYTAHACCEKVGIRYTVTRVEQGTCYFKNYVVKDPKEQALAVEYFDEIWIAHNRSGQPMENHTIYLNKKCNGIKPSSRLYYLDEMANGNVMESHLDTVKSLKETISCLEELYDDRIHIEPPDEKMLLWDYYISRVKIEEEWFCMDVDYGIITISPEGSGGNKYIREIVAHFNGVR
ncbi:MAG: hypothetical protein IJN16_09320 [Lachnospiraceae bacterium]|nr:hypothetical protein [Lachnospiraceae bacterium]